MACSCVSCVSGRWGSARSACSKYPTASAVRRSHQGLLPRMSVVHQRLVPHFAPQGVERQAFDLRGHLIPGERFEGRDDPGMERSPPLLEQTPVGHLMGEGVLEGVLALRKEPRLIEELSGLEMCEATMQTL